MSKRMVVGKGLIPLLALGLMLTAGTAFGAEITIHDNTAHNSTFGGGPFGIADEDNEVQGGAIANQTWDLEGFHLNGLTLSMVGGWNFDTDGSDTGYSGYTSGDIFISFGTPLYGDALPDDGDPGAPPIYASDFGYDYIIDVVNWSGGTGYDVYKVVAGQTLVNPVDLALPFADEANPWTYDGEEGGAANAAIASGDYVNHDGTTTVAHAYAGGTHHQVDFDLGWLLAELLAIPEDERPDSIYFHFALECGNDMMMGMVNTGDFIPPVPEPASIALVGLGLAGVAATRLRKKRF